MTKINGKYFYGIREVSDIIKKLSGLEFTGNEINKILLEEGYISFFNGKDASDGYLPSNKFQNSEIDCRFRLKGEKRVGFMVLKFNEKGIFKILKLLDKTLVK